MRKNPRIGPRCVDAPTGAPIAAPRRSPGDECHDYVDLARRMSIRDDDAIRQFVDRAMSLAAVDRHHDPL